jgi:hypothetical protein
MAVKTTNNFPLPIGRANPSAFAARHSAALASAKPPAEPGSALRRLGEPLFIGRLGPAFVASRLTTAE